MDEQDNQQEIENKRREKVLATGDKMKDVKSLTKDSNKKIVND